jgi:hypothetical protein
MVEQIIGHYIDKKEKLLREFDYTSVLLGDYLVSRFGMKEANCFKDNIRQEFEKLIPEIPYIPGIRGRSFNSFLLITAQELAVYKAMKNNGKKTEEA